MNNHEGPCAIMLCMILKPKDMHVFYITIKYFIITLWNSRNHNFLICYNCKIEPTINLIVRPGSLVQGLISHGLQSTWNDKQPFHKSSPEFTAWENSTTKGAQIRHYCLETSKKELACSVFGCLRCPITGTTSCQKTQEHSQYT